MKRLLTAAVALSVLGGSAAMAQPRHDYDRHDRYERHDDRHDRRAHRWTRGERLPPQYRTRGYYVDYRAHHLRKPPRGYQWVRVNDQYLMVAVATGLISSILASQY